MSWDYVGTVWFWHLHSNFFQRQLCQKKKFEFQICIPHIARNLSLAIQSKGNSNWLYRKFKEGKIVSHKSTKHIISFLSVCFNKHILLRIFYLNYTTTLSIQKSFHGILQSTSIILRVLMMYTIWKFFP